MGKRDKPSWLLRTMPFKSTWNIYVGFSGETLFNLGWGEAEKERILLLCKVDNSRGFS